MSSEVAPAGKVDMLQGVRHGTETSREGLVEGDLISEKDFFGDARRLRTLISLVGFNI